MNIFCRIMKKEDAISKNQTLRAILGDHYNKPVTVWYLSTEGLEDPDADPVCFDLYGHDWLLPHASGDLQHGEHKYPIILTDPITDQLQTGEPFSIVTAQTNITSGNF